ncbi:hypothetical protein CBL_13917 [Carabus blaptoides fortunei]
MGIGEGRSHSPTVPQNRDRVASNMPGAAIPLTEQHQFLPPGLAPDTQSGLVMEVVSYDMIRVYITSHVFYLLYCHIRPTYILIPIHQY